MDLKRTKNFSEFEKEFLLELCKNSSVIFNNEKTPKWFPKKKKLGKSF